MEEHVPKCSELYIKEKSKKKSIEVMNAAKSSVIAENLVKHPK